ncbi:hypothetical protein HK104_006723 [Borealophlyctis nickersoniae]|nr:hypothetical protein HK104_006723 [Borealophlyctis nickersoniae]
MPTIRTIINTQNHGNTLPTTACSESSAALPMTGSPTETTSPGLPPLPLPPNISRFRWSFIDGQAESSHAATTNGEGNVVDGNVAEGNGSGDGDMGGKAWNDDGRQDSGHYEGFFGLGLVGSSYAGVDSGDSTLPTLEAQHQHTNAPLSEHTSTPTQSMTLPRLSSHDAPVPTSALRRRYTTGPTPTVKKKVCFCAEPTVIFFEKEPSRSSVWQRFRWNKLGLGTLLGDKAREDWWASQTLAAEELSGSQRHYQNEENAAWKTGGRVDDMAPAAEPFGEEDSERESISSITATPTDFAPAVSAVEKTDSGLCASRAPTPPTQISTSTLMALTSPAPPSTTTTTPTTPTTTSLHTSTSTAATRPPLLRLDTWPSFSSTLTTPLRRNSMVSPNTKYMSAGTRVAEEVKPRPLVPPAPPVDVLSPSPSPCQPATTSNPVSGSRWLRRVGSTVKQQVQGLQRRSSVAK